MRMIEAPDVAPKLNSHASRACQYGPLTFGIRDVVEELVDFVRIVDRHGYRMGRFECIDREDIVKFVNDELRQDTEVGLHLRNNESSGKCALLELFRLLD